MIKKAEPKTQAFRKGIFLKTILFIFILALVCASILLPLAESGRVTNDETVFKSRVNLYPEKSKIDYARGFDIEYHGTYKIVSILNSYINQTDTLQYLLVDRKYPVPKGFPGAQVIRTPVKSIVSMSSMHVAMVDFAESANAIVGHGSLKYVTSAVVRKNAKDGKVKEVGLDGSMNHELLISMRPDIVMVMGNPTARFSQYQTVKSAGVAVLPNNEWLEATPLARMEWVKLIAALFNKEEIVNKKFSLVEQEYHRLAKLAQGARTRPIIIAGLPFKGTWSMPDADSYSTQFFKDAGAAYKWTKEKNTGSLSLSFEAVAPTALKADYWLNLGYVNSKKDVLDKDERFAYFKPYKTNKIFNHNKKVNDIGANDFWESGGVNPHIILADLIKILHPELLPKHKLVYYKQLL